MVPLLNAFFLVLGVRTEAEGFIQKMFTGKFCFYVFFGAKKKGGPKTALSKNEPYGFFSNKADALLHHATHAASSARLTR